MTSHFFVKVITWRLIIHGRACAFQAAIFWQFHCLFTAWYQYQWYLLLSDIKMRWYCTLVWINSCFCTRMVDIRTNSICPAFSLFFQSKSHCIACHEHVNDVLTYWKSPFPYESPNFDVMHIGIIPSFFIVCGLIHLNLMRAMSL